ncbi:MAG TPA: nucleotidyltransferase domain-containing protein [Candidatus Methylomirabilis sp.]|nr:nucleotidyltransferase domain-containing protein [Candidatus Methylomirabilis sp.]
MLSTEAKLTDFVSRMKEFAGGNLESIILYGSAARGDFQEGHSDLNVLCVLRSPATPELARVSPAVHWWCHDQHEPPPLFFTAEELRQSADVFPIELLDMQQSHRVLHGADVIAAIHVPTNLHRIQLEHDLRTLLLKLRQHFLFSHQKESDLRAAAAKSTSSALILLRHTLVAFNEEPPSDPHAVLARIAALTGADAAAFAAALQLRDAHSHPHDILSIYARYVNALSVVISALDKRIPKKEWQRTSHSGS